jgi:tetratricopeptide (TPR) repeat protein
VNRRAGLRRFPIFAILAALLAGCVYYNGMYNTNRLARSARKAEREGRPYEAQSLWGQVITRAESVEVRHPRSKYAPQAAVLRGLAMSRLGQCEAAIAPLNQASLLPRGDLADEAALALGRCQLQMGDPASADLAFAALLESRDKSIRTEARYQHGRALRMTGHFDEAVAIFRSDSGRRVADELLIALAGAGQEAAADSLAVALLASNDTLRKWDSLVVAIGRVNPTAAGKLVDRLGSHAGTSPAIVSRRLYEDGLRLEAVDSARAMARYREAIRVGPRTEGGDRASFRIARQDIAGASSVEALGAAADTLRALQAHSPTVAGEATQLLGAVVRVRAASDSGGPEYPQGDLRLFLAGEVARDSLKARTVASELFRRIVDQWSDSPYAPKALLAAQLLDSTFADSAQVLFTGRYYDSPYMAMIRGDSADGYRVLEDSLQAFAAKLPAGRAPPPGVRRRPGQPNPPGGDRRRPREPDAPDDASGGRRDVQ